VVEATPFLMPVSAATELLSADKLTGVAVSDADLSCPFRWPFGDAGGDGFVCSDDTDTLGWCRRVLPGSLSAISFRTAFGLSVPENNKNILWRQLCHASAFSDSEGSFLSKFLSLLEKIHAQLTLAPRHISASA
jgi:hypothetical protein